MSVAYQTKFGSLQHYEKGGVQPIADDVKNYAFSNCFEIASKSKPYEKVVFGQNQIYVLECAARRRHVALVHLRARRVRARDGRRGRDPPGQARRRARRCPTRTRTARSCVKGEPQGPEDGLDEAPARPPGAAAEKHAPTSSASAQPGVVVLQTCKGDSRVERWAEICQTA